MYWYPVATAVSFVAVVAWRIGSGADAPGELSGQTLLTIVVAALMNVVIEFVKRWQTRSQQSKDAADGAEVLIDGATKLVTTQNTNLDRYEQQLLKLDARLKSQDDRIARQEERITQQDDEIERARTERAAQDKLIGELKRDKEALDDWVRRLTQNQEQNIERIKELTGNIERLRKERDESDAKHAEEREVLTANLRALEDGVARLSSQLTLLGHKPDWTRSNGT